MRNYTDPVVSYAFVGGTNNDISGLAASGGDTSLITYATSDTSFDGFGQGQAKIWDTTDPGADLQTTIADPYGAVADTGGGGHRSLGGAIGTLDISGLATGSVHVYYGSFSATPTVSAVMRDTDGGAPDITIADAHLNGDTSNRTEYYVAELKFLNDAGYDEIEYTHLANGTDYEGNGRGLGTLLTGTVGLPSSLVLTDFSYDPSTGNSEASIAGEPATAYILVEADDLDFSNPDQSPVALTGATVGTLDGNTVITDANGDATVQFSLGTSKDVTFIRAENAPPPPPLLSEDFESVTGPDAPTDWSRTDNSVGTAWEVGAPGDTATGPVAAANGTQCAGTNIDANYTASAVASLITKAFTVPASGATLSFSQYIDTEESASGDLGSIRLLNADDDSVLAGGDVASDIEGITEAWSSETLPLPDVANGLSVKLEFRFESDADVDVFAGFYIDDVVVTGN